MNIKKQAIKFAKIKANQTKTGRRALKTAKVGGVLLGGTLITVMLANYGKKLSENKDITE